MMPKRAGGLWAGLALAALTGWAVPPYGDPNQPYDKLPGTWETWHVAWLTPLPEGRRHLLFIVPFAEAREVVELAQRLDLDYAVIMTAGRAAWALGSGGGGGSEPTTLMGVEAEAVVEKIASRRLSLAQAYDGIVIGKVSWEAIPEAYRNLILEHVKRGAGLTYVSPHRQKPDIPNGENARAQGVETAANPLYTQLFVTGQAPEAAGLILDALPFDLLPLKRLASPAEFAALKPVRPLFFNLHYRQVPVCITASKYGQGRVLALQYFDQEMAAGSSSTLTPAIEYDATLYDCFQALLARCVRWSCSADPVLRADIGVNAPATDLQDAADERDAPFTYEFKTPAVVIDRKDLPQARVVLSAAARDGTPRDLRFDYQLRDLERHVLTQGEVPLRLSGTDAATHEMPLPTLPRGNYLVDLRLVDSEKKSVDFVSRSFRVESAARVSRVTTDRDRYRAGEVIRGQAVFAGPLAAAQQAEARARDTWQRWVGKVPVTLNAERTGGTFELPVTEPRSDLWDVSVHITDAQGDVAAGGTWVGIPQDHADNFVLNMTFCEGPDTGGWKGVMAAQRLREFGVNSWLSQILYQPPSPGERCERANLHNLYYADDEGGQTHNPNSREPFDTEFSESCPAELSRIHRYVADTGTLPDNARFPYRFNCGGWTLDANHLRGRILDEYIPAGKFGTPFYTIVTETYLSGEMAAKENSCFCPLCTSRFQEWCRKDYNGDLAALNAEWNAAFTGWDQVRGILMMDAVRQDQLPRWVDFRFFMRSEVWTRLFLDYTDMIRRFVPGARTGHIGHKTYDYSLFRDRMTCGKVYQAQDSNPELHTMVEPELLSSFSNDESIMIGSCGLINWYPQYHSTATRTRFPWKMLFLGFRGYDMERNLSGNRLGGESWLTPCMSERLPFFQEMSDQVLFLQRGLASLVFAARPYRSKVAVLWSPRNHFISRLDPFQENAFSGSWLYNVEVEFGAPHDCLAMLQSIRVRGKMVAPEDLTGGMLERETYRALFLPYSKGMSVKEADAIRAFVRHGGLLIADNTPGIYTEHGRKLEASRLSDLFPALDRKSVTACGKGHVAYLNGEMNGYMARMEKGDYTGSDALALLLRQYAGIAPLVDLTHEDGTPRRDTLMPAWTRGSATYVGLLRQEDSKDAPATRLAFGRKYHVYDVRKQAYLGYTDRLTLNIDAEPRFLALLPVNPSRLTLAPQSDLIAQGRTLTVTGQVEFGPGSKAEARTLGQVAHVRVYAPDGKELEWFRKNVVFDGAAFALSLPLSYSEVPGVYTVVAEHTLTGMTAQATFAVVAAP
jgi:hypothetical protein